MIRPVTQSTGTLRPMLRLAWPVLVEQLLIMMVGLVDLWLTGNYLQNSHLAAIGLMSYVIWLLPCLFGVVAIGSTALVARFVGAGNAELARDVTNQSFVAGALVAVAVTAALVLGGDAFVRSMQLEPEAAELARRYLRILAPVVPAIMIEQIGIACLRGAGDMVSGFVVMSVVNIVNVAVGASLVIGIGPVPRIGWEGLAIGTACGYGVAGVIVAVFMLRGRGGLRVEWRRLRPRPDLVRRIFRIGVPGGADMVAVVACHLWFLSIVNRLGTDAAAAHGLAIRIESLAYLPGTAFQVAAATLAGQFLGARDEPRARRSVMMACAVGGGLMVAAGFLFFFGGGVLTRIFLGDQTQSVAELSVRLLRLVSFSMPSLALTMILSGALRGAGDTRWPLVFTFAGLIGVRIPLAYLLAWESVTVPFHTATLPALGLGVFGAWIAMLVDNVLRSVLVVWRFWHGGWTRIDV